jgi:Invasion associated locus B (IalB) protein
VLTIFRLDLGKFVLFVVLCAVLGSAWAEAASRTLLASYVDWYAFTEKDGGRKVCYVEADPRRERGRYRRRGDVYIQVIHSPATGREDVAVIAGYTYKQRSKVTVKIGPRRFRLVPDGDTAWTPRHVASKHLVRAMRKGRRMVVRGISSRGTLTTDTYSLVGFTDALRAARRSCR